jgi:hypothetical protein
VIRIGVTVTLCLLSGAVLAQELVGKALVDGREVELFSDQTWRFSGTPEENCKTLSTRLSFCGDSTRWQTSAKPTPDVIAAYRHDSISYGQFIIEDLGTDQGLTMSSVRKFILDFAGQVSGEPPVIISTEPITLGGLLGETIVYSFTISGLRTVYSNTVLLGKDTLLQAITYQLTDGFTDEHKALHDEFIAATRLAKQQ